MNFLTLAPINPTANVVLPKVGTLIPNRIFVGGITSTTTEDDLSNFFGRFGPIKDVKVIYDRSGLCKGSYGFVTFENQETAEMIIKNEAESLTFNDRKINIGYAVRKQHIFQRQEVNNPLIFANSSIQCPVQNGISILQVNGHEYCYAGGNFKNLCSPKFMVPKPATPNEMCGSSGPLRNQYKIGSESMNGPPTSTRNEGSAVGVIITEPHPGNRMNTTIIPPGSLLYTHSPVVLPNGPGLESVEIVSSQNAVIFSDNPHCHYPTCDAVSMANITGGNTTYFANCNQMNRSIHETKFPNNDILNPMKQHDFTQLQKPGTNDYRVPSTNVPHIACECSRCTCHSNAATIHRLKLFTQSIHPTIPMSYNVRNESDYTQNTENQQYRNNLSERQDRAHETRPMFAAKFINNDEQLIKGDGEFSTLFQRVYDGDLRFCSQQTNRQTAGKSESECSKCGKDRNIIHNTEGIPRSAEVTTGRTMNSSMPVDDASADKAWYNNVVLSSLKGAIDDGNIWCPREREAENGENSRHAWPLNLETDKMKMEEVEHFRKDTSASIGSKHFSEIRSPSNQRGNFVSQTNHGTVRMIPEDIMSCSSSNEVPPSSFVSTSRWLQSLGQHSSVNFDKFCSANLNENRDFPDQSRMADKTSNEIENITNQLTENMEKLNYLGTADDDIALTEATPSGDTRSRNS